MAFAAWMVWKRRGWGVPNWLYLVQLILNTAWTPIFFGAHELGWALVEIIALWFGILVAQPRFNQIKSMFWYSKNGRHFNQFLAAINLCKF